MLILKYVGVFLMAVVGIGTSGATIFWLRPRWDVPLTLRTLVLGVVGGLASFLLILVSSALCDYLEDERKTRRSDSA